MSQSKNESVFKLTHTQIDTICGICLWHWHTQQNLKDGLILVTSELNWVYTNSEDVKLWAGKLVACVISALYSKWPNLEHPRKQRKSPSMHIFGSPGTSALKMFQFFSYQKQCVCTSTKWFHSDFQRDILFLLKKLIIKPCVIQGLTGSLPCCWHCTRLLRWSSPQVTGENFETTQSPCSTALKAKTTLWNRN